MTDKFTPTCPKCGRKAAPQTLHCEFCGAHLLKRTQKPSKSNSRRGGNDPLVISVAQLKEFLEPYVDQETFPVLAAQFGIHEAALRRVFDNSEYVGLGTVDRWFTSAGLTFALHDGSLTVIANPGWSRARFENHFLRCGENPPFDVMRE